MGRGGSGRGEVMGKCKGYSSLAQYFLIAGAEIKILNIFLRENA